MFETSPRAMLCDKGSCCLPAFIEGGFRACRVDRTANAEQGINKRQGREEFEKMDMPAH